MPKLLLKPKLIISSIFLLTIAAIGIFLATTQLQKSTESRSKASESACYFPPPDQSTLKQYAQNRNFLIGAFLHDKDRMGTIDFGEIWNTPLHKETFAKEFNLALIINRLYYYPAPNQYDFTDMDKLIDFATTNNLKLFGGGFIFHDWSPPWFNFSDPNNCGQWDTATLEQQLKSYIQTPISRGGNNYLFWNIVNEPLDYATNQPYQNCWYKTFGEDYILKAYQYAREANPNASLVLNETFGISGIDQTRASSYFALLQRLRDKGAPIDTVGIQMHLEAHRLRPSYADEFRTFLQTAQSLGLKVIITEMDVYQGPPGAISNPLDYQKQVYKNILAACLDYQNCLGLLTFGLTDKYSWLKDRDNNPYPDAQPLLFDDNYQRKPAYYGLMEALAENTTRVCLTPPTPPSPLNSSPYGTNAEIIFQMYRQKYTFEENLQDVTQQVQLMKNAGIIWAREHIRWNLVEPTQGNWNWQPADTGVDLLTNNSSQILAVLGWPPSWASSAPSDIPDADKKFYPPQNIADWNNYVTQIVTRYKDKIHAWEILNEVDQPDGTFKGNESQYLDLLQNAYQIIKSIDPNAQVLIAGATNTAIFDPTSPNRQFITNLINLGAEQYFDIFSFHGFYLHHTASDLTGYIQKARSLTTKPLWNTEIGVSSNLEPTDDCLTSSQGETIQAEDLPIFYRTAIAEGVEKVFWWRFQDTPSWKCHYFGLVRDADQNYALKPAYSAYQQLTGTTPLPAPTITPSPAPSSSPSPSPTPCTGFGCLVSPTPTPSTLTGDINTDGIVDITDYSLLVSQFLQTGSGLPADLNQDGLVDITDYSLLVANFLKTQ